MSRLGRGLFVVVVFLCAFSSAADIASLTNQRSRPTVAELLDALQPWPAANPFPGTPTALTMGFRAGLPHFVAQLEKAYPGAIWAPLGRDAVGLGDQLDAFYRSIGQPGRVVRLNASGGTVRNIARDILVGFLRGAGYDVSKAKDLPPFILLDRTSYNLNSQTRHLLRAGYEYYAALGGDANDLANRFNAIRFNGGNPVITAGHDRNVYTAQLLPSIQQQGHPGAILALDLSNGLQIHTQPTEFHSNFGALVAQPDGTYRADPIAEHPLNYRQQALYELFAIIDELRKNPMLEEVRAQARALGFEFQPEAKCVWELAKAS